MGKPSLRVVKSGQGDEIPSLPTGAVICDGTFTVNDVVAQTARGFIYSALNSAGQNVTLTELFPASLVKRDGYADVTPLPGSEADFEAAVEDFGRQAEFFSMMSQQMFSTPDRIVRENGTIYAAFIEPDTKGYTGILDAEAFGGKRPKVLAKAIESALRGLEALHEAGLVHGSLAPDNLLVSSRGEVLIRGFSLLHEGVPAPKADDETDERGAYLAPELLEDETAHSPRSDLYALAASFYHAVTRKPPPESPIRAASAAAFLPDPYSPLRKVAVLYRSAFRRTVDAALSVDPADRPASAAAWLAELIADAPDEIPAFDPYAQPEPAGQPTTADLVAALVSEPAPAPQPDLAAPAAAPQPAPAPVPAAPAAVQPVRPQIKTEPSAPSVRRTMQEKREAETKPAEKKSGAGLMIGAGAAVLALAVGGFMFMGGEDAPEPVATTESTTATETAAVTPPTASDEPDETVTASATEQPEPVQAAEEPSAAPVEDTAAADPAPEAAPAETPVEPVETAAAEPVEAEPSEPVEQPSEEAAAAEQPAEPQETAEEPAAAEPEPVQVEEAEPEVAEAAEEPVAPEPAPEPVETAAVEPQPRTLSGDEAEALELANSARAASGPATAQPGPETGASFDIASGTAPFSAAKAIYLPFTADPAAPDTILLVGPSAAEWMVPGVRIASVDGETISDIAEIDALLRSLATLPAAPFIDVPFGTVAPGSSEVVENHASLPIIQEISLQNGLRFALVGISPSRAVVTGVPPDSQMQPGDQLISYTPTNERIGTDIALADLINREVFAGKSQFTFLVSRGEDTVPASFIYGLKGD